MDSNFHKAISRRILKVLESRPLTLCNIINKSQGAYPDDVIFAINHLAKQNLIFKIGENYQLSNHLYPTKHLEEDDKLTFQDLNWIEESVNNLSKPHPADYDWRFTNQSIFDITQLVIKNKEFYTSVALFGTTTLYPVIKKMDPNINLSLFNKSQSLIEDLYKMGFTTGLHTQDLFTEIPYPTQYKLVIADPPWYADFYNAFISRASEVLEIGGDLFLSVLPVLTRPEAEADRIYIDQCCIENGFEKRQTLGGFVNYESPIFEKHSLLSKGIDCGNWRKGDLIIYKKVRDEKSLNRIQTASDEPLWEEYSLNGIKLKLLRDDDQANSFSFENSDITPILSTVSRRSPLRTRINFWTSENFAFKISKLKVLRYLLTFVNSHNSLELALKQTKVEEKLTDEEFNSLINLLKIANIIKSG